MWDCYIFWDISPYHVDQTQLEKACASRSHMIIATTNTSLDSSCAVVKTGVSDKTALCMLLTHAF